MVVFLCKFSRTPKKGLFYHSLLECCWKIFFAWIYLKDIFDKQARDPLNAIFSSSIRPAGMPSRPITASSQLIRSHPYKICEQFFLLALYVWFANSRGIKTLWQFRMDLESVYAFIKQPQLPTSIAYIPLRSHSMEASLLSARRAHSPPPLPPCVRALCGWRWQYAAL